MNDAEPRWHVFEMVFLIFFFKENKKGLLMWLARRKCSSRWNSRWTASCQTFFLEDDVRARAYVDQLDFEGR